MPARTFSAGIGNGTSGSGRGFGELLIGGMTPGALSIGSTSSVLPP